MLTIALTIVIFIAMLAVLILSHEFGHFIVAKRSDVKVEEFGIGFPPKLASIKRGETVYSLNLVPLGGFVKLLGEEDPTETCRHPRMKEPWELRLLLPKAASK